MELVVAGASDKAFDEAVLDIQQQVTNYKDMTSQKLQKLEATIEVARKLMLELTKMKAQQVEEGLVDFEPDFGKGNMTQEWTNPALVAWEAYTGEPFYDEEQGKGQDSWPEQEFILAALNRGNLDATKSLQSEISISDRSEELADVSNIQDLQQKNVSPGEMYIDAYNVMQPGREEKFVEISAKDPHTFQSIGSLTTNCMVEVEPQNFLHWSTEDKDMPFVANNSSGKFELNLSGKLELNGHSLFLDEKGIYTDLSNLPEPNLPIEEVVQDLKPVSMPESANLLKLNDLSTILSCPSSELEWIEGDMKIWFLRTATSHCFGSLADSCEDNVFIFDPGGGGLQNTNSKGVIIMLTEKIRHEVTLDDVLILISVCGQLGQLQDIICWKLTIDQLLMEQRLRKRVIPKYSATRQVIPEMDWILRLEDQETSRKSVQITIFDPGGYIICVYEVQLLGGTAGTLNDQKFLQEVFTANEFLLKGQEGIVVNVLIKMYVLQVERSLEVHEPP